jgi:hypothetical protein
VLSPSVVASWSPEIDAASGRRSIAGFPVRVHSQHFARLQHTIMTTHGIDGSSVLRVAARQAFAPLLARAVPPSSTLEVFTGLFAALGLGQLGVGGIGIIDSRSAHAAHAWVAAFGQSATPVCAVTEGFLEAVFAAMGQPCEVREIACIATGAPACRFAAASASPCAAGPEPEGAGGLDTAYGQCVATVPATFFGVLGRGFLAAMDGIGQLELARDLLAYDTEDAVMRMFAGVLRSRTWADRVDRVDRLDPVDRLDRGDPEATLTELLAISRELGWGSWQLERFVPGPVVLLSAPPSPSWLQGAHDPTAALAGGAAAGLCELVLCEGALDERFGALQICTCAHADAIAVSVGADDAGWVPGGLAA